MLQQLGVLVLSLALCRAHIPLQLLEGAQSFPAFSQHIVISDGTQQLMSGMHSPMDDAPMLGQPLFGMSRSSNSDWDSWMDSQFDALNAMNQALLGRRGGCGGHMRQQSLGPVLIQGVPSMTTPSAVMQRLAAARFGESLLKALVENRLDVYSMPDEAEIQIQQPQIATMSGKPEGVFYIDNGVTLTTELLPPLDASDDMTELLPPLDASDDMEDDLGGTWEATERMLSQEDEDEEAEAEADATETDENDWASLLPSWISAPEDQLMTDPAAPASSINWSLANDDGSTNWGLVVFMIQVTACISVWAGLVATLGYYRFRRSAARSQQFATSSDSHLMTPLMYEPVTKGDDTAQLYNDLYPVEDAKLHADDKQYVAIQYVPLKSEV